MPCIAVVDDDSDFVSMLRAAFDDEGWETVGYGKRLGAVNFLVYSHPDLIIVDLGLEHPDAGWTLVELLREGLHSVRDVPIVVCSGDATQLRQRSSWLRSNDIPVVQKPFELDEMIGLVRDLLAQATP
jgi:DNA-binding response OmpR family regulator